MGDFDPAYSYSWTAGAACAHAEALSQRLKGALSLLRLAAFAAEAWRTLDGIEDAFKHVPQMSEDIRSHARSVTEWTELPGTTREAFKLIAQMIEQVQGEFTVLVYELAAQFDAREDAQAVPEAVSRTI